MKYSFQASNPFGEGLVPTASQNPLANATATTPYRGLEVLISNLFGLITVLAGLAFLFYFIMGGVNWVTSGGEKGKLESARNQMMYGVIGLVIIIAAYGIIGVIGSIVGIDILNLANTLENLQPTP